MQVEIRSSVRRAARLIRNDRDFIRAARRMPKPVPWEWAKPRLVPLLSGPCDDAPGSAPVRARSALGCWVDFGIDLGGHFPLVDGLVAERWETSPDQLLEASIANIERRAGALATRSVRTAVRSGWIIRILDRPKGCASSVLLAPTALRRLFGDHDQFLAAPGRHTILSFPIDMPTATIADIAIDHEMGELMPLFLQPFALVGGELAWADGPSTADDEDW